MPKVRATLNVSIDGAPARRFPIIRSTQADVVVPFDFQQNPDLSSDFEELIEDRRLGALTVALLQPDAELTFRLAGQSDAGFTIGAGGLALLFGSFCVPPTVKVDSLQPQPSRLRGLLAGVLLPSSGHPMLPTATCPATSQTGLVVTFIATPPSGTTVINYHWDFGDGTVVDTGAIPTVMHTYVAVKTYFVTLTVQLLTGEFVSSHLCSVAVQVPPGPPTPPPPTPPPLTVTCTPMTIETWEWLYADCLGPVVTEGWEN